jgi:hypothetical protein
MMEVMNLIKTYFKHIFNVTMYPMYNYYMLIKNFKKNVSDNQWYHPHGATTVWKFENLSMALHGVFSATEMGPLTEFSIVC